MIEVKTERQQAETKINFIKEVVANTKVDYFMCETPYTLSIKLKKKFLTDHSLKSPTRESQIPSTPSLNLSSMESSITSSSPISTTNASGLGANVNFVKCSSCQSTQHELEDAKKELIANILESKQSIANLETENERKDKLIKRLETELKSAKEEKDKIRVERDNKNDQLKVKNKKIENLTTSFDKLKMENENSISNFKNKIENLEKSTKNINAKLTEKNIELKEVKIKLRKIESQKKEHDKATETKTKTKDVSTQIIPNDNKSVGTSPLFSIIPLLGEATHHITCFCSCHSGAKCEVQLFKYTNDSEEAVEAMYYREEYYDDWSDYDESNENTPEIEDTETG